MAVAVASTMVQAKLPSNVQGLCPVSRLKLMGRNLTLEKTLIR